MDLVIKGLTKKYNDKIAVNNIDLHLQEGVNGLLGANGAGKTTLMRMICGIITPDSGSISFNGIDVKTEGTGFGWNWKRPLLSTKILCQSLCPNSLFQTICLIRYLSFQRCRG